MKNESFKGAVFQGVCTIIAALIGLLACAGTEEAERLNVINMIHGI